MGKEELSKDTGLDSGSRKSGPDVIRILNPGFPLEGLDDLELVSILRECCQTYEACRAGVSPLAYPAWVSVCRLARELVRRK